jgi:hypothetical protein
MRRQRVDKWRPGDPPRRTNNLVVIGIAALFFGVASMISILAPVHVLTLERNTQALVNATATRRLLLVIPIGTRTLQGVTSVSHDTYYPEPGPRDQQRTTPPQPEAVGTLTLVRQGETLAILTSPAQLADAERSVREFLEGSDTSLRLHLVSNWKFAVIATVLVALPGVLLVVATLWDVVTKGLTKPKVPVR